MAVYHAITGAHRYLARALIDATGMELHDILAGILPSLLIMVAVLALSTTIGAAAGAALGALAGGVGAIPGAAAGAAVGLEAGTALLEWLGLAFLVVYIGKSLLAGTKLAATAVGRAWHSVDQSPAMREVSVVTASHELATAVALVFRGVLQGVVAFLLAKGVAAAAGRVPELVAGLRKSRLGGSFAEWVERNWAALIENSKLREAPDQFAPKIVDRGATTPSGAASHDVPSVGNAHGTEPGSWRPVNESMSDRARAYQAQITGRSGESYVVDGIKFDGYGEGTLLEAKGPGYANFVRDGEFQTYFRGQDALVQQAQNQLSVSNGAPVVWHVAEAPAAEAMQTLFSTRGISGITVVHTPVGP